MAKGTGLLQVDKKFGLLTNTNISITPNENIVSCDGFYILNINVDNRLHLNNIINEGEVIIKDLNNNNIIDTISIVNGKATLKIDSKNLSKINIQAEYLGVDKKFLASKSNIINFTVKKVKNPQDLVNIEIIYPSQQNVILSGRIVKLDPYYCYNSKLTVVAKILPQDISSDIFPTGNVTCRIIIASGVNALDPSVKKFRVLQSKTVQVENGYVTFNFDSKIGTLEQEKYIQIIYEGDACFNMNFTPQKMDDFKINFIEKDITKTYLSLVNKGKIYNLTNISINAVIKSEKLEYPSDGYVEFYASDTANPSSKKIIFDNVKPVDGNANLVIRPGRLYPGSWQIVARYISNKETNCYQDSIYNYLLINVNKFVKL